jgi:hypothetical protein
MDKAKLVLEKELPENDGKVSDGYIRDSQYGVYKPPIPNMCNSFHKD